MHFLAALAVLPLAFGSPLLSTRSCTNPTSFVVNRFDAFTTSPSSTGNSNIYFTFSDSTTDVSTTCSRSVHANAPAPADPNNYYSCNNTNVTFLYTGSSLYLKEKYPCNGHQKTASGNTSLALECYPEAPPVPNAPGTNCDSPTGSPYTVSVSSVTS